MTPTAIPTLYVVGTAEREVTPDQVEVALRITTLLHPEAADALADAAGMRARVTDVMGTQLPGVAIVDRRISVREEGKKVERRSGYQTYETHFERRGFTGHCEVILKAAADRAAELVAHGGAQPDVGELQPAFTLSADLRRATLRQLEGDAVRDGLERAADLAAAAGGQMAQIISIGEWLPGEQRADSHSWPSSVLSMELALEDSSPRAIVDALGEIRPEPLQRSASVPVRVALAFP